jgi:hypothetical protein
MKRFLIFQALLCSICFAVFGQKGQKTYFMKSNGQEVGTLDSADFVRIVNPIDSGNMVSIKEYHKISSRVKVEGFGLFRRGQLIFHGDFNFFDDEGLLIKKETFDYGRLKGLSYHYYKNGLLKKIHNWDTGIFYTEYYLDMTDHVNVTIGIQNGVSDFSVKGGKLVYFADSLGRILVKDGNGYLKQTLTYFGEDFDEEGNYKNGFKEGKWFGQNSLGSKIFREEYKKGELVSGIMEFDNKKYRYNYLFETPHLKSDKSNRIAHWYLNGINFYDNLVKDLSKDKEIDPLNIVLYIGKKGEVLEVAFEKKLINKVVEKQLKTVFLSMPKWEPGKFRGLVTTTKYISSIPLYKSME